MHVVVCFEVLESSILKIWYFKEVFFFSQRDMRALFAENACKQNMKQVESRQVILKNKQEKAVFLPIFDMATSYPAKSLTIKWEDTYFVCSQLTLNIT